MNEEEYPASKRDAKLAEKDAELVKLAAEKDAELAEKDAEIEALRQELKKNGTKK